MIVRFTILILATILFAALWTPSSLGQLASDLGPFALNGCLTFDKNDKVYLVRRSSDFINTVGPPTASEHDERVLKFETVENLDGQLLPIAPPAAAAEHHGSVAGPYRSGRIQFRQSDGFQGAFASVAAQPFGLSSPQGFVLPDANALLLNSAQTVEVLDTTNNAVRSLHEHLLVAVEKTPPHRNVSSAYRAQSSIAGSSDSVGVPSRPISPPRPQPTQDDLNIVDQVLLDLFLDGVADRMNAHLRWLGKTPKGDLAATAYGIIKQGRQNGSLLLGEVVEFMINELDFPADDVLQTFNEISPNRLKVVLRNAGLLDLNGTMSDEFYAAFVQVVGELDCSVKKGNSRNMTATAQARLESLISSFDPESQLKNHDRKFYEKIQNASRDMIRQLERLTSENGSVSREELIDAIGNMLFETDVLKGGTMTSLQEQMIVDVLQNLDELDPEANRAIVEAFLSLRATQPTFRAQVDPCTPVCGDARAWKHDIWFEGFGNFTNQWASANLQGYSAETWGFQTGIDRRIGRQSIFGIGFGGAFGSLRTADRSSRGDNESFLFSLYGATTRNDWTLSGAVGYVYTDFGMERFMDVEHYRSSHDGNMFTGSLMLSRSFKLDQTELTPFIGFNYMKLREDEFAEADAEEELLFGEKSTKAFKQTLGVRFSGEQKLQNGWIVSPAVSAGWLHDYGGGRLNTAAGYDGGPAFVVDGVSRNQNRAVLGFSLGTQLGSRLSVFASYNGELSQSYSSQTGQLGLNLAF